MAKETNIHKGHRGSMRRKYLRLGADAFLAHELLEILLYYAIPVQDTNPTAHRLLDTIGTLGDVLSASKEVLCGVRGIGSRAADLISLVYRAGKRSEQLYLAEENGGTRSLDDFVLSLAAQEKTDTVRLLLLDAAGRLLAVERVFEGTISSPGFEARLLVEPALRHRASIAVLCTYPRNRTLYRGGCDYERTVLLRDALSLVGVRLAEHYVVTDSYAARLSRSLPGCLHADPDVAAIFREGESYAQGSSQEDARLLSALLGYADRDAVTQGDAEVLLQQPGGLYRLLSSPASELISRGVSEKAAILLSLSFALYVRAVLSACPAKMPLDTAEKIGELLVRHYLGVTGERVLLLLLDSQDRLLATELFSEGSVDGTPLEIRRIAELTLRYGAASVVLAHNHPGATVCPSPEDEQATCLLDEALRSVGVVLLEHYVIARGRYTPIRLWSKKLCTVRPLAFYGEALMARVAGLCFHVGE